MKTNGRVDAKSARRIAFELHALSRTDRAWLLERLSSAQRRAVEAALAELARHASAARDGGGAPGAPAVEPTPAAIVARASPEAVHALLEVEAECVVAPLLAYRPWPWTRRFLRRTSRERRRRLERATTGESVRVTALVQETLLELVAESLRGKVADDDGRSPFETTLRRLEADRWPT